MNWYIESFENGILKILKICENFEDYEDFETTLRILEF